MHFRYLKRHVSAEHFLIWKCSEKWTIRLCWRLSTNMWTREFAERSAWICVSPVVVQLRWRSIGSTAIILWKIRGKWCPVKANSQPAVCGAAATIAKIAPGATCTPFEVSTFLRFQERAEAAVFQRLLYASLVILEILVTRIGEATLQEAIAVPRCSCPPKYLTMFKTVSQMIKSSKQFQS